MSTELRHTMDETLRDRQLLDHPFYRRWEAGALTRDELTHYAEQSRYFEAMLPTFLQQLSDELSPGAARDLVDANLADEVTVPSHPELFDRFARCYDAETTAMSPAMQRLVAAYGKVQSRGSVAPLAGLLAYESQGAAIGDSKAAGLVEHYDVTDEALLVGDAWWAFLNERELQGV